MTDEEDAEIVMTALRAMQRYYVEMIAGGAMLQFFGVDGVESAKSELSLVEAAIVRRGGDVNLPPEPIDVSNLINHGGIGT